MLLRLSRLPRVGVITGRALAGWRPPAVAPRARNLGTLGITPLLKRPTLPAPMPIMAQRRTNMMQPRRMRFRKANRGFFRLRLRGSRRGTALARGDVGLIATQGGRLTAAQMEHCRQVIRRMIRPFKGASVGIRVFTDRPVTEKGIGIRMGKGKGQVEYYAKWVPKDTVLFEVRSGDVPVPPESAKQALLAAAHSLPVPCGIITRASSAAAAAAAPRDPSSLLFVPHGPSQGRAPPRALPGFVNSLIRERRQMARIVDRRAAILGSSSSSSSSAQTGE